MPDDAEFVRFIAARYPRLHGYGTAVVAVGIIGVALMWPREWGPDEWWTVGALASAVLGIWIAVNRYYAREFGRVRSHHREREPWYGAIAIAALESGVRRIGDRAFETGLLAIALAGVSGVYAWREWRFRKTAALPALALLYIGIDRLTASADIDLDRWLARAAIVFAAALLVVAITEHRLLARALSPGQRPLAVSALAVPSGPDLPWPARDPAGATIVTALHACEEADVTFLGNIAGIRREQADARLEDLKNVGLVAVEDRGRGPFRVSFAHLTPAGHDIARTLWM